MEHAPAWLTASLIYLGAAVLVVPLSKALGLGSIIGYLAAGIVAIAMDLRNLGTTDLTVRLYFEDPIPGPPLNEAVTTLGVLLPAGGAWTHALFPIAPDSLTVLQGNATTLLSNTTVLRIFAGAALDFPPAQMTGVLGVDNIQAVPEPETIALLAASFGSLTPTLELRDPSGTLIASATATPGGVALIQAVPATAGGVYTITVGGASGTSGFFSLQTTLNAAVEQETYGGGSNDTIATAQNLDPTFTPLLKTADRGAVLSGCGVP